MEYNGGINKRGYYRKYQGMLVHSNLFDIEDKVTHLI